MVEERVSMYVSPAEALEQVDKLLLPPEQAAALDAEQRARENLQGAIGLGLPIIGMPGAGKR